MGCTKVNDNGSNKVLLVSRYRYPNGDAGSVRQELFAKMFADLGLSPTVIGLGTSTGFKMISGDIPYSSFRYEGNGWLSRIKGRLLFSRNLAKQLKNNKYGVVLAENIGNKSLGLLKKYSQKEGCVLIFDSVEWYSPEEYRLGELSPEYRQMDTCIRKVIDHSYNVIAISSYLEDYYSGKGINTKRLPVLMDVSNIQYEKSTVPEKVVITYAGAPGRKDYIASIVEAIDKLSEETKKKLEFRMVGCDLSYLIKHTDVNIDAVKRNEGTIRLFGRVPRTKVLELLQSSDFTILIRPENLRYTKAGFPTKVVESLASGTPVICNITSDLGVYLNHGSNAVIVKGCAVDSIAVAISEAVGMNYEKRITMSHNARRTAEDSFDYHLYEQELESLFR